ncbi:protein YgfX [Vibrio salinus]|uniref:protein YgfX n=1 Tax=Vibrio salinus TaxID=2899784 RepID=UPI001E41D505|nr:protein YgfX [Vibrio salinus]MCE0493425.1 hypothetical protein [Vibrio salinus]
MLTTRIETVKFYCRFSFHAFCLELVLIQLYLYVVLSSSLDIALSFALFGYFFQCQHFRSLLKQKCYGDITYSVAGRWQDHESTTEIKELNTTWSHWFLMLFLSDGRVRMLWRDSCNEPVYRYLIVREKQRQNASALVK